MALRVSSSPPPASNAHQHGAIAYLHRPSHASPPPVLLGHAMHTKSCRVVQCFVFSQRDDVSVDISTDTWLQFLKIVCWLFAFSGGTLLHLKLCPKLCCLENACFGRDIYHAGLLDHIIMYMSWCTQASVCTCFAYFDMMAQAHQAPSVGTWDSRGDTDATGSRTGAPGQKHALATVQ